MTHYMYVYLVNVIIFINMFHILTYSFENTKNRTKEQEKPFNNAK